MGRECVVNSQNPECVVKSLDPDQTPHPAAVRIKVLTALVGRFSLSVGWENGPEWELKTVSFNRILTVTKANRADPDQTSAMFAYVPVQVLQITFLTWHSHVTATRIARL